MAGADEASIASHDRGALWVVVSGKAVSTLGVIQAGPPSADTAIAVGQLVLDSLATGREARAEAPPDSTVGSVTVE